MATQQFLINIYLEFLDGGESTTRMAKRHGISYELLMLMLGEGRQIHETQPVS